MRTYSFRVTAAFLLFCAVAGAQLRITTSSVPVAAQYQSYSTPLSATGGTLPYTWSVVSSTGVSLPEGMSLNPATGVVSAVQVNGQGGYTVTVRVADSGSPAPNVATATINFGVTSDSSYGGCQMFPPDSIYNQRIDLLPVDTTSTHQIPSGYLISPLHPDFGQGFSPGPIGIPFMRVAANQPVTNVNLASDSQIDANGTYTWPFPAWPNAAIEGTSFGAAGNDHHILIVQSSVNNITGPQTGPCTLYETYQSTAVPSMYSATSNTWFLTAGLHYVLNSNEIAASASTLDIGGQDSPGVPIVPLLIRYSEVPLGVQHPLRITFPSPTNWFVWPGTGCCTGSGPPQGLLYRLKASVNWQAACPANTNPQAATVLQALQQYGAYMSDHGSSGYVQGVPDVRWDDNDLGCIKKFHVSDLEVVDNSALEVSAISGQTKPYVVPATLPNGTVGAVYSVTISAVGGNPATRQWMVTSGALPPGLLLAASTGIISGTINSSTGSPYSFGIAATDTASGHASQTQQFSIAVTGTDTTPPSIPANVSATAVSTSQINVSWSASTDNVGVAGYRVYRNGGLAGTVTTLTYSDTGLAASTTYSYTVAAFDAAGNVSSQSSAATATTLSLDTTPPTVAITAPIGNTTVSNTITVTATASDNVAVADVQFQLDGVNLGADLTTAPYSISWNTTTASNGSHNLTAIARDTSHNTATSAIVQVTVNNTVTGPPTAGLIGYWNFDEGSGSIAHDTSGSGYNGTVNAATWTAGKINTGLSFNGTTSDVVTPNIALGNTFSISAWVNPTVTESSYARIAETQYSPGFYLGTNVSGAGYKLIINNGQGVTGTCGAGYGCAEGGAVTSGWHLVTATFDGTTGKLYVDNAQVGSDTFSATNTSLPLYIGRYFGANLYGWVGSIDEVRLYNRALTNAEVTAIYNYTGGPPDTTPPSTPGNVSATAVSTTQINVSWSASTDNVGVAGYRVYRNAGLAGTVTTLTYSDTGLAASTTYSYTVAAFDAAGNVSSQSSAATATTLSLDTTPPTVAITAPTTNTTVSNTITVTAMASDNVAVGDVQFQLDGVNLGADLTTAPYSISWNTTTASNGSHNLTAIARDTSHNTATSAIVQVTVSNTVTAPPTAGLIGYWNFDEGSGSIAHDTSGSGYNGTVNAVTWTTGKNNSALSFNGTTSDVVTPNIALGNTFSISAWVNPGGAESSYGRIAETQYSPGFYLGTNVSGAGYKLIINNGQGVTGTCGAGYGCAEGGAVTSGWHLVTATFDGTMGRLYVDNALVGSDTFSATNTNLPLYIGRYFGANSYGWVGSIDEVRLYNRALTGAEVTAIYNYTGGPPDTTPPSVAITAPIGKTTVSNTITVTATASDNVAVADVQFQLDGVNLGADLTTAPYSISWNTTTASNGSHNLTAIARDTSHNTATSAIVQVTVSNTVTGPPTAGLIGYWNFDEGSGGIAHDSSGSAYNGTLNAATWTAGKINTGLSFNGTTSDVVTPNIALGNTFSISAWVNPTVTESSYARIAETQYSPGFYLGTNVSGAGYKFIINNGQGVTGTCGAGYGCAEGGAVTSGWHLVTATFDGTTGRLYVDNALVGSDTFSATNTNLPLYIGRYFGANLYGWVGSIDEVRLYNRALTAAEVNAIFSH